MRSDVRLMVVMSIQEKGKALKTVNRPMRPRWPPRAVARLSAGESAISRDLGPPRDPEEGGRDRQQEREQEERDGGALREVARLDAREHGQARGDLGRG